MMKLLSLLLYSVVPWLILAVILAIFIASIGFNLFAEKPKRI
jgi:ABC-type dipeptide/oligopeptide/nickel transport system permease subunit